MRTKPQTFAVYGYLISCILSIISLFIPLFSYTLQPLGIVGGSDVPFTNYERGIMQPMMFPVIILSGIGIFMILVKYRRVPVFVLGLISGVLMIYGHISTSAIINTLTNKNPLFKMDIADIGGKLDVGAGFYLSAVAGVLQLFFTVLTFILVKNRE